MKWKYFCHHTTYICIYCFCGEKILKASVLFQNKLEKTVFAVQLNCPPLYVLRTDSHMLCFLHIVKTQLMERERERERERVPPGVFSPTSASAAGGVFSHVRAIRPFSRDGDGDGDGDATGISFVT